MMQPDYGILHESVRMTQLSVHPIEPVVDPSRLAASMDQPGVRGKENRSISCRFFIETSFIYRNPENDKKRLRETSDENGPVSIPEAVINSCSLSIQACTASTVRQRMGPSISTSDR